MGLDRHAGIANRHGRRLTSSLRSTCARSLGAGISALYQAKWLQGSEAWSCHGEEIGRIDVALPR